MTDNKKKTEKITIRGIVQGVGFRPFVSKLAREMEIDGTIKNMGGYVRIIVSDDVEKIDRFMDRIQREKPMAAEIVIIDREDIPYERMQGFRIEQSEKDDADIGMIPGDTALCDDCLREYFDPENPRYRHPFISCMVCGPRYTIIDSLPYDRDNTTMRDFPMCDFCSHQYNDIHARRYHAQTVSCHQCGPMPEYHSQNGNVIVVEPHDKDNSSAAKAAIKDINDGKVIAFKGTGGYYFVCSPFMENAVEDLRKIKIREEKPFAIMFQDVNSIKAYCLVSDKEEELLTSGQRPIVLLEKKANNSLSTSDHKTKSLKIADNVGGGSRYIGAFLPGIGLQYQLLEKTGPLIMTSANLSDLPIIYNDEDMFVLMKEQPKLTGILMNRRKIRMSLDDSVTRVIDNSPQFIRRSKGYVPVPLHISTEREDDRRMHIFSAGSHLKSVFALSKGNFSYLSQHFGDLFSVESQTIYKENVKRMKNFFGIDPKLVVCDMHPLYYTTEMAEEYVRTANDLKKGRDKIELLKVQHHHAHTASVMAEHGLIGPVIGVCFDGTGYGTDGNIWGGEFLICEKEGFERYSHLRYIDIIGGDSSMKDGWKSAVSYRMAYEKKNDVGTACKKELTLDITDIIDYSNSKKTLSAFREIPYVEAAVKSNTNTVKTSGMGRLFDGVASLLGIHHINKYEGQCAIMLENAAFKAIERPGANESWDLALKFHHRIAKMILEESSKIRKERGLNDVTLSGGVFQNKILTELTLKLLRSENFSVYYNISVPANDGGIALGQNYIGIYHNILRQ